jgi:hypothetical protein
MTSPVERLRADLDQLRGTSAEWMQAAAGLGATAPPPVTTPQWPTGIATSALHGATDATSAELSGRMSKTAAAVDTSSDAFSRNDTTSAVKLADVAALISASTAPVGQLISAGGSLAGQALSALGSFGSQFISAMMKGQGPQVDHQQHQGDMQL